MRRRFAFSIDSGFFEITMRGSGILAFLWLFSVQCLAADDKWVWGSGRNSNAARLLPGGKYGVIDEQYQYPSEGFYRPQSSSSESLGAYRPPRPLIRPVTANAGQIDRRPYPQGAGLGLGSYGELPPTYQQFPPPQPLPSYGGGGGGIGNRPQVGPPPPPPPRPNVDESYDPTKFQKCKCTHSFNCRSPGILFGECDAGKKYCCEKEIPPSRETGIPINDGSYPEVLAGPGGPVDHLRPAGVYGRSKNAGNA